MSVRISPADRIVVTNFRYSPGSAISVFSLSDVSGTIGSASNGDILVWDAAQQKFVLSNISYADISGGTYDSTGSIGNTDIQIRYSTTFDKPLDGSLKVGELAYSLSPDAITNGVWDGGQTLYVGDENGNPIAIGSKRVYDYFNHSDGNTLPSSAVITDANGAIDILTIGRMDFDGTTIAVNKPGQSLFLSPGGLGNVSATGHRVVDVADPVNPQDALTLNYLQNNFTQSLVLGVNNNSIVDTINLKNQRLHLESTNTVIVDYDTVTNTIKFNTIDVDTPHVIIANTAPTNVVMGDLWYDADNTGRTYVWDTIQWIDIAPQLTQQDLGLVFIDTPPTAPVNGQVWYDTNTGISQVWSGSAWSLLSNPTDEKNYVIIANTAPANVAIGQLWYNSNTVNRTYVWDGATWLDVAPDVDTMQAPIVVADVPPTAPMVGAAWYDADNTGRTYVFDGVQWVDIAPTTPTQASETVVTISSVPPSAPWVGMPWYDNVTTTGYIWDGARWLVFSNPDSGEPHSIIATSSPASPKVGDFWVDADNNNHPYAWDGSAWLDIIPPTEPTAPIIVAAAPPASPLIGSAWYDSDDTGRTYVWDGFQWVDIAPDTVGTSANTTIHMSPVAPTSPWVGMPWYDSLTTTGYIWNGASWVTFSNPDSGEPHSIIAPGFPTTANVGDFWIDSSDNNHPYVWNGSIWADIIPPTEHVAPVVVANNAPTNVMAGDLWYDADNTGRTYVWDGSIWVDMAPDLNGGQTASYVSSGAIDLSGLATYSYTIPSGTKKIVVTIENYNSTDVTGTIGGWVVDAVTANRTIEAGKSEVYSFDYPFSSKVEIDNYVNGLGSKPTIYLLNKYTENINSITIKPRNSGDGIISGTLVIWTLA